MKIPTAEAFNKYDVIVLHTDIIRLQIAGIVSSDSSRAHSSSLKTFVDIYAKAVIEAKVSKLEEKAELN